VRLKHLLVVNVIVSGSNGIIAVSMPALVLSLYGVTPDPTVILMSRYAGLGSLAIALVALFARNVEDVLAQRAIIRAFLLTNIIGVIISVQGAVSGVLAGGWPLVGVYLVLASLYAFFQFTGPNPSGRDAVSPA
jgi:hypothetical protein